MLQYPNCSLADLNYPFTMPPVLTKAHNELYKAVGLAYKPQAFTNEANSMIFFLSIMKNIRQTFLQLIKRINPKTQPII
jgi:hypothetical protein